MTPRMSVVMPTRNRADVLRRSLALWSSQVGDLAPWELIVIDDGSADGTAGRLRAAVPASGSTLVALDGHGRGPASARNLGIRHSRAPVILFVNDDVLPSLTLASRHLAWHERHAQITTGLLGRIDLPDYLALSPFARWYHLHRQFNFSTVCNGTLRPSAAFFTANVSIKRALIVNAGEFFDEQFVWAAFEDLELGARLERLGLTLAFDADAHGVHDHPVDVAAALERMTRCGRCSEPYALKTRRQASLSTARRLEHLARCASAAVTSWPARWVAALMQRHLDAPRVFDLAMQSAIHAGLARYHVSRLLADLQWSRHA